MIDASVIKNSLHTISQGLLAPTIIILIFLLVVSVASVGSIVAELLTERRRKEDIPKLILAIHGRSLEEIEDLIQRSGLLRHQKAALCQLLKYRHLPEDELYAVAKKLIANEDSHYEKLLGRTELVARIAPMLGLMGTLIPLGPGMIALGQGDTKTLSESLLTGFDTTVAGLASAAVCFVISKIRKRWYEAYMVSTESLMDCMLKEVQRDEQKSSQPQLAGVQEE